MTLNKKQALDVFEDQRERNERVMLSNLHSIERRVADMRKKISRGEPLWSADGIELTMAANRLAEAIATVAVFTFMTPVVEILKNETKED